MFDITMTFFINKTSLPPTLGHFMIRKIVGNTWSIQCSICYAFQRFRAVSEQSAGIIAGIKQLESIPDRTGIEFIRVCL